MGALLNIALIIIIQGTTLDSCPPAPTRPTHACSGTHSNTSLTEDGTQCVFPFFDGAKEYYECADFKGLYEWCATSLKNDCSFRAWGKCAKQKETTVMAEDLECVTEQVNPGMKCLFPFKYEGKEHNECLPYKTRYWCGLTYEYNSNQWGYCTQEICPPTKAESTPVYTEEHKQTTPQEEECGICGVDSSLDTRRLIAEENTKYIMNFFDHTDDPTPAFKTFFFDVMSCGGNGNPEIMLNPTSCPIDINESGMYFLFLVPPKMQCNRKTFLDAKDAKDGYYPVYLSSIGNFEEVIQKFKIEATKLGPLYDGKFPKLCGSKTKMTKKIAEAIMKQILSLFNFIFNGTQKRIFAQTSCKVCSSIDKTKDAIEKSGMFDLTSKIWFSLGNSTVTENDGLFKVLLYRKRSNKQAIGFLETSFPSKFAADQEDIVPYNGPIVFEENVNVTEVYIQIKPDDKIESGEIFQMNIKEFNNLKKFRTPAWYTYLQVLIFGQLAVGPVGQQLAEFDNSETGPFRQRNLNGGIGQGRRRIPYVAAQRTIYKSTYSIFLNIPIRAIVEIHGRDRIPIAPVVPVVPVPWTSIPRPGTDAGKYSIDLREKVRPDNADQFDFGPNGIFTDFSHPDKYTHDDDDYTRGHLISSDIFRTFFTKERNANLQDIQWDLQSYMTNMFPQTKGSNGANAANGFRFPPIGITVQGQTQNYANWGQFENAEMNAGQICLGGGQNYFYIAKGTIPSGSGQGHVNPRLMINHNIRPTLGNRRTGATNVNIPRYLYMAYCCSKNIADQYHPNTEKYVIFEHRIVAEHPVNTSQTLSDRIYGVYNNANDLLTALTRLWRIEHPTGMFTDPILFKTKGLWNPFGRCAGGFDIDPYPMVPDLPYPGWPVVG